MRAERRAEGVLGDLGLEILVGVEATANGVCLLGPPDLNEAVPIVVGDRWFPVLSLPTMLTLSNVTGDVERAEMVTMAIGGDH